MPSGEYDDIVSAEATPNEGSFSPDDAIHDLISHAEHAGDGIPTGYSIDDECGRMGLGELGLVWARSSAGKSTLMLNFVANSPQIPTVVFNMEMTARRQLEWLASMTIDLPVRSRDVEDVLRRGPTDDRYESLVNGLTQAGRRYPNLRLVSPREAPTVSDLAMAVEDAERHMRTRIQRVFVDHLGLMSGTRDYEGTLARTSELHAWALQAGLAVIVLQQAGRSGGAEGRNDGHIPVTISSGVYGGEADADWIWGVYRPEKDPRYLRRPTQCKNQAEYDRFQRERAAVRGLSILQLVKNRPYGDLNEDGTPLRYVPYSRRLEEVT